MKNAQTLLILLIISLLFSCRDSSVEPEFYGEVIGQVLFADDLTPLINVEISTTPSTETILTDSLGKFHFEALKTGEYAIKAELEGYVKELVNITVEEIHTTDVVIQMEVRPSQNDAPEFGEIAIPEHGAIDLETNLSLTWEALDFENDELKYDLKVFENDLTTEILSLEELEENTFELTDLKFNTTYFWQVLVYDDYNEKVESPIWQFKTQNTPDHRLLFVKEIDNQMKIMCSDFENDPIKITIGNAHYWRPKLSPNRDKIALISTLELEPHIFTMDIDGTNLTQITDLPIAGTDPMKLNYCWSPDGSQLLYMHLDKLYKINHNGTGLSLFAEAPDGQFFTECDWNGYTNQIVALTSGTNPYDNEIYLFDEDGNATLLVENVLGTLGSPSFSIDGTHILFTYDISGFEDISGRQLNSHIFLLNLEDQTTIDLSINKVPGMNDLEPRFSPTGGQIIFTNTANDGISRKDIWTMDLDGTTRTLVLEDGEMADWN